MLQRLQMPVVRVSQQLYDKIRLIMKATGWRSPAYVLDKITKDVRVKDFSEVGIRIVVQVENGGRDKS